MLLESIGKLPSSTEQQDYEKKTPCFHKGKFHNIKSFPTISGRPSSKAPDRIPGKIVPVVHSVSIPDGAPDELNLYWLGHSSALVQLNGENILIDPVLSKYASPFRHAGVKRYSDIPIAPENLPEIDIVLLSHDHYDHMDYGTIMAIRDRVRHFIVPLGVETILKSWGVPADVVTALNWWEETNVDGITVTATPAQHFSTRNPLRPDATWWCGFVFTDGKYTVYYSGDGGYAEHFREIGTRFAIDLALMECGQYDEAWSNSHMFPEQTVLAAEDVGARWTVPIHWGAYCLCNSSWNDSVKRALKQAAILGAHFAVPKIGQRVCYGEIDRCTENWWEL